MSTVVGRLNGELVCKEDANVDNEVACSNEVTTIERLHEDGEVARIDGMLLQDTTGMGLRVGVANFERPHVDVEVVLGQAQLLGPVLGEAQVGGPASGPCPEAKVDGVVGLSQSVRGSKQNKIGECGFLVGDTSNHLMSSMCPRPRSRGNRYRGVRKLLRFEEILVRRMARGAKVTRIKGATPARSWHRGAWCQAAMVALSSSSSTANRREGGYWMKLMQRYSWGKVLG
ncbi:hypothetical protein LOK49_LG05G00118 [Camellia lanceoleosa]|uniref:Uncharacterized protein n=1 Tax=Camellia lanceoleosa TaxID=1840588 RepID=A0ACC0HSW3_9ERIC|nr:hypothetical protein LOK49_LG05G00118 [Camellia lanceoleosa]